VASAALAKYVPPLPELALVSLVGFGLAQGTRRVPALNTNPMLTRTLLYTLGYLVARGMLRRGKT
jgi:hypothetical protein